MDYILFWLAKPLAEFGFAIVAGVVVVFFYWLLFALPEAIKQARCKHERVRETMACDAVCQACGKNLGFIGNWRKH